VPMLNSVVDVNPAPTRAWEQNAFSGIVQVLCDERKLPDGWASDCPSPAEPITLTAGGHASVVALPESVPRAVEAREYADGAGALLKTFLHYRQHDFRRLAGPRGRPAYLREYSWTYKLGRVRQFQLYLSDPGSAYVITATAFEEDFARYEGTFKSLFRRLGVPLP
jgi:hypothetical protein